MPQCNPNGSISAMEGNQSSPVQSSPVHPAMKFSGTRGDKIPCKATTRAHCARPVGFRVKSKPCRPMANLTQRAIAGRGIPLGESCWPFLQPHYLLLVCEEWYRLRWSYPRIGPFASPTKPSPLMLQQMGRAISNPLLMMAMFTMKRPSQ